MPGTGLHGDIGRGVDGEGAAVGEVVVGGEVAVVVTLGVLIILSSIA